MAVVAEGARTAARLMGCGSETGSHVLPPSVERSSRAGGMIRQRTSGSGEVAGKTGTAQFGDGTKAHGWFTGYRDDVAFAVLTTDSEKSGPALQAAQRFLGGM